METLQGLELAQFEVHRLMVCMEAQRYLYVISPSRHAKVMRRGRPPPDFP